MSWQATSAVVQHSKQRGMVYTCLLILSNYANPDGGNIFPSIKRVAHDCRCDERSVQRYIKKLLEAGEIILQEKPTYGTYKYLINPSFFGRGEGDRLSGGGDSTVTLTIHNNPRQASDGPAGGPAVPATHPETAAAVGYRPYGDEPHETPPLGGLASRSRTKKESGRDSNPTVNSNPHGNASGGKGGETPLREQGSVGRPSPTPLVRKKKKLSWKQEFAKELRRITPDDPHHLDKSKAGYGYYGEQVNQLLKHAKDRAEEKGGAATFYKADLHYLAKLYKAYNPKTPMTASHLAAQYWTLLAKDLNENRKST